MHIRYDYASRHLIRLGTAYLPRSSQRHVSLSQSITKGLRQGVSAIGLAEKRRIRGNDLEYSRRQGECQPSAEEEAKVDISGRLGKGSSLEGGRKRTSIYESQSRTQSPVTRRLSGDVDTRAPIALPYTTASTEFIYGTFAVLAALKAKRRKFYKLYVWAGDSGISIDAEQQAIVKAANSARVPIKRVAGTWDKILDKFAGKRPHNGFVLESTRLPISSVRHLVRPGNFEEGLIAKSTSIDKESRKESKLNPSTDGNYVFPKLGIRTERYPLLLFLDRITDSGNMGAIFRTAYLLGVEAVIVPEHGTALLSAVAVKASAGAVEQVPVLSIKNELDFVLESQEQGWKFFAAGAAETTPDKRQRVNSKEHIQTVEPFKMLQEAPCVLMLGNEGTGLRPALQRQADYHISIPSSRGINDDVDSFNVSVAAALLMDRFLLKNSDVKVSKSASPSVEDKFDQNTTRKSSIEQATPPSHEADLSLKNQDRIF